MLFVLLLSSTFFAMQGDWTSPLKECWSFDNPSPSRIRPASDNDKIYITTSKGSIIAINHRSGTVIWEADLGGNLWTEILAENNRLFATAFFGRSDSNSKAVIREINPETGVPFWQMDEEALSPFNPVVSDLGFTTFFSENGVLLRLNQSGEIQWRKQFNTKITSNLAETGGHLLFGTSDKTVVLLDAGSGKIVSQFNSSGIPTRISGISRSKFFTGDESGRIQAFDHKELLPLWTAVTGAAITSIQYYDEDLIVSSNDNFVYRISGETGNKIWKRKLAGRILGNSLIDPGYSVYLTTGSTTAVILSLNDGSLVNKIDLGRAFVSGPVAISGGFAVPTESTITAVTNGSCSK